MKQVKIIFENNEDGEDKRFGYILDKASMTYKTVNFDQRYEPYEVFENRPIGDPTIFGKSIWRLIRMALMEPINGQSKFGGLGRKIS